MKIFKELAVNSTEKNSVNPNETDNIVITDMYLLFHYLPERLKKRIKLAQWFSQPGPQISPFRMPWEFVRNADLGAPLHSH